MPPISGQIDLIIFSFISILVIDDVTAVIEMRLPGVDVLTISAVNCEKTTGVSKGRAVQQLTQSSKPSRSFSGLSLVNKLDNIYKTI